MYVYNCICIPARALAFVFVFVFHSHKKNTNICICFEQKLTFWVETIIVIVMHVMLRLKRIKVQTIWLEWIFFSKVGFIRLMCKWNSRAFSFHMNKTKPLNEFEHTHSKNSFHLMTQNVRCFHFHFSSDTRLTCSLATTFFFCLTAMILFVCACVIHCYTFLVITFFPLPNHI